MAAIRDGLGRVRVAGEAIYQRRRKDREAERKRYPLQRVASPPMVAVTTPFLVLSSFHSLPLSLLRVLSLASLFLLVARPPRIAFARPSIETIPPLLPPP